MGRKVGCVRKNVAKVVYDVLVPQYPPDQDLCPPPGESTTGVVTDIAGCGNYEEEVGKTNYILITLITIFFIFIYYKYKK